MTHEHSNSRLYPCSIYHCSACGKEHGTRPFNGAVNWQCPNELVSGTADSHAPARQDYIGYQCHCGQVVVTHINSLTPLAA